MKPSRVTVWSAGKSARKAGVSLDLDEVKTTGETIEVIRIYKIPTVASAEVVCDRCETSWVVEVDRRTGQFPPGWRRCKNGCNAHRKQH